jgi:hypothetical protein
MALCRCNLQIDNLDKLIFVNKPWPSNPWIGYVKPTNLASTCEVELNLTTKLEAKFQNDVDCEDFLDPFNLFFSLYANSW